MIPALSHPIMPSLSRCAAELFTTRQAKARWPAARQMTERQASDHLRPWLAIACLARADLPELEEPLADQRVVDTEGKPFLREGELRTLAAAEIAPRATWQPLLIKATDQAIDKAEAADQPSIDRALDLLALCRALGVQLPAPNQTSPAPTKPAGMERSDISAGAPTPPQADGKNSAQQKELL